MSGVLLLYTSVQSIRIFYKCLLYKNALSVISHDASEGVYMLSVTILCNLLTSLWFLLFI